MLTALVDLAGEYGVPAPRLCAGLGFSLDDLRGGMLLSHRQAWRMIRRALQLSGRSDLGLELGRRENPSHFGLPGFAMLTAKTFSEAVDIGLRYQAQAGGMTDVTSELDERHLALIAQPRLRDADVLPFLMEEVFASVLTLARIMTGHMIRPHAVELSYAAPAHADRYHEVFQCPVRFGCDRNRLLVDRHWLNEPLATHSPVMSVDLRALLEQRAKERDEAPQTIAAVEQVLNRAGSSMLSIKQVASALDLSVRTLRRRLEEAGTSFRSISDRIYAETAQRLLRDQGLTVAEASERLGFSDTRAFRRAFKRWVGQAPGELRHSHD